VHLLLYKIVNNPINKPLEVVIKNVKNISLNIIYNINYKKYFIV